MAFFDEKAIDEKSHMGVYDPPSSLDQWALSKGCSSALRAHADMLAVGVTVPQPPGAKLAQGESVILHCH
jgi:hypothetical protein